MTITSEEMLELLKHGSTRLWPLGNVASNRLGWFESPREMEREGDALKHWADTIDQEFVILLGMGGSSLDTAVLAAFAEAFGESNGRRFIVCDTTEPSTIVAAPFEDAFVLVSSKSGTTLETSVLFDYAMTRQRNVRRYAVITDPGTPLAFDAKAMRVNRIFENRPDIGGRYSVLSYFGMVPAALMGYDVAELAGRALEGDHHDAIELGIQLGEGALEGRDKATILVEGKARPFGLWVEQLIAESTGKLGRGIVPVPTDEPEGGEDRNLVPVEFSSAHELGAAFYRFEIATAIAGHVLDLDPFDEPNVAESKANTARVLSELPLPSQHSEQPGSLAPFLDDELRPGDYVSIQAYLPYGSENELDQLRKKIRDDHGGVAVTAGYGPRFLHSTGQLHKGGPNSVIAVQLVANSPREELAIPDKPYDFATLIEAQAIGDRESLISHGRRVVTIAIDELTELL